MASQVLIPYHFTEHSFKETCQKMHFFGTDQHEFILAHQLPKRNDRSLLISIDDLVKKKTEAKLIDIITQLKFYHPDENIQVRALAMEALTPTLIQQCQLDYAVFDLQQITQLEKQASSFRNQENLTQIYCSAASWQKESVNLLWLVPTAKHTKQYHYIRMQQQLPTNFNSLHQEIGQRSPFQTGTLKRLPMIIQRDKIDLLVIR